MAKKTIEQIDAAIARWQSRLKRSVRAVEKLEAQRKRLLKAATKPPKAKVMAAVAETIVQEIAAPPPTTPAEINPGIPAFLRRGKLDPAAEQILKEQQETKRRKASGRIATMKAKKGGETRKMPLTGKAALAAIRNA